MTDTTTPEEFFAMYDEERQAFYEECYHGCSLSWAEIAKMIGTYPNRVRRDATKLGIKSRDRSAAQSAAISEGRHEHPTRGKKRTEEVKAKISEGQGRVWDNLSEEERERRSEIGSEAWNKKSASERADFFKKSTEAIQAASVHGSKVENYLHKCLAQRGYKVAKHQEHILKNERFHIDLYIPACRTAIEVDGPMHFKPVYGEDRLRKRQAADSAKNGLILSAGMVLIRVKLTQRESQRYLRDIAQKVMDLINIVEDEFPKENERYFEV
jgi:very-short-patch-repair endonuclease